MFPLFVARPWELVVERLSDSMGTFVRCLMRHRRQENNTSFCEYGLPVKIQRVQSDTLGLCEIRDITCTLWRVIVRSRALGVFHYGKLFDRWVETPRDPENSGEATRWMWGVAKEAIAKYRIWYTLERWIVCSVRVDLWRSFYKRLGPSSKDGRGRCVSINQPILKLRGRIHHFGG